MAVGECKICGLIKELTKEHIPPKSAMNSGKIKLINPDETVKLLTGNKPPWEKDDLKYSISQNGLIKNTLCKKCNNFTGRNYVDFYKNFVLSVNDIIQEYKITTGLKVAIEYDKFNHLRVFKQIITMFASLSNITTRYPKTRDFILDVYQTEFPSDDIHVYADLYLDGQDGLFGPVVSGTSSGSIVTYQIKMKPLILTMVVDFQKSRHINYHFGYDLTHFHEYNIDNVKKQVFEFTAMESHTFVPTERRSKKDIGKVWNDKD